jgi:amidase
MRADPTSTKDADGPGQDRAGLRSAYGIEAKGAATAQRPSRAIAEAHTRTLDGASGPRAKRTCVAGRFRGSARSCDRGQAGEGGLAVPASYDPRVDVEGLAFAGVAEQARLVRAREVAVSELVELYLERIARHGAALNCITGLLGEEARAAAQSAQRRVVRGEIGPMLGCPVMVKDNTPVRGRPTTHGSGAYEGVAAADSLVVERLRRGGAIVIATTTLPELAQWGHMTSSERWGVTRNPWNLDRSPGGSSGGSAAAVAAGLCGAAIGSDGGCSIRVPAALCGLVGLKPQRGRIPLAPDIDHWYGLTVFGPLTRSVEDAALLCDVLSGPAPGALHAPPPPLEPFSAAARREPGRLRVALSMKQLVPVRVHRSNRRAVEQTATLLRSLGHEVVERDPRLRHLPLGMATRWLAGTARDAERMAHPERLERRTRSRARVGRRLSGRPLDHALRGEPALTAQLNEVFQDHDVLLTPVTAQPAPAAEVSLGRGPYRTLLDMRPLSAFTAHWNATGQPAMSVPAGIDADGMPTAVQLVGRANDEATLITLAAQLEHARPWTARRRAALSDDAPCRRRERARCIST